MPTSAEILEMLNGMASGGGAPTNLPRPLGVPADYMAPVTLTDTPLWGNRLGGGAQVDMPPQYFEGDEWAPASTPATQIAALQQQMVDAGLLKGKYRIGIWDPNSRDAYKLLLETANGAGVDEVAALRMWAAAPPEEPEKVAPPLSQLSNPADLRAVFKAGAKKVLGRGIDDATIDAWVSEFQGAQRTHQESLHAMTAGPDAPGGVITAPMSQDTFAETKAAELDPLRAGARKATNKVDMLVSMLGEGGVMNAQTPEQTI